MKAMILAAGLGKRLKPLTNDIPKPLLKVGNQSLIERNILNLKEGNVGEIVINLHHYGEKIVNLLGDGSSFDLKISYSVEDKLLGTGGGIQNSLHHFDEPFIVISSDVWTDFDFKNLTLREGLLANMILVPNPKTNPKGDTGLSDGLIDYKSDQKKYTYSGIAVLSPDLFQNSETIESELWNDFLKPASLQGLVSGEIYEGTLQNLNSLEEVETLDALLSEE